MKPKFNETYFFETLTMMYLYKKGSVSTEEIEKLFGDSFGCDSQHVNNIISNRNNKPSCIKKLWLEYDKVKRTLSITSKGRRRIEKLFGKRRH